MLLALAAVVAVALGAGLGSLDTSTAGQPPASPASERAEKQPPKDAAAKPAQKEVTLTGRVLNPDGKPLAGAKLFAGRLDEVKEVGLITSLANSGARTTAEIGDWLRQKMRLTGEQLKEVGTSGFDGKFTVKVPAGLAANLIARAEGAGMDFLYISPERLGEEIELRLVKDNPVRSRIVDTQGKPVVGATVAVSKLDVCKDNSLDGFLADVKRGFPPTSNKNLLKSLSRESGVLSPATTDQDGRFTIAGTGVERPVTLRVSGAGLADTEVLFLNRKDFDPKPYNEVKPVRAIGGGMGGPGTPVVYHGPDGSVVVEAEKRIRGTVTDVDTGKPRVGAKVTLVRDGLAVVLPNLSAVTNAEGKYEIRGVRKSTSYAVAVDSDPATRYLTARVRVNDTAGYEPLAADLKVKKGVLVTGKVIDLGTKEPVRGFAAIAILRGNKFVKEYPEFDTSPGAIVSPDEIVSTDEGGIFRIVTIPGPVLLMAGTTTLNRYQRPVLDPDYPQYFTKQPASIPPVFVGYRVTRGINPSQFCKVLEIKADAETLAQDVLLELVK
ncbi:MAG: carboxypeptidase-like regulatory domain-containing protein [Gemmataceae bacterium]